ncbi:DUF3343 domain-containing protein [Wansuia hejianensis]|uniref:DUF3343 domain-containing protein n=1 Tax=Wansuia hejianensis TaxID=2763667 RepID=A0A926IN73_9FIRM|nr:DUF3343 domain-containing protein [Wansuia hejianensis]MBC8590398.1 DUF3343 domain-containing protein [Wansuia hejianensis]
MKREIYGLITFKSTHFALQGEVVFKDNNIVFKTIPTPREVSHSCGLALLFMVDDIDIVKNIIEKGLLQIDGLYRYTKDGHNSSAEKIL